MGAIGGRIGNPGCTQGGIGDGKCRPYIDHFRDLWTHALLYAEIAKEAFAEAKRRLG